MSARIKTVGLALALGSAALTAAVLGGARSGQAQNEPLTGVWTAERSRWKVAGEGTAHIVQLGLRRRGGGRGNWNSAFPVPLTELRGLSAAQIDGPRSEVRFELMRDAGTLTFEGRFQEGEGAGHFAFAPSAEFLAAMRQAGYGNVDGEKAFSLAVHDVSRAFIRDLGALGYERLTLDQLVSLRIHGASPQFIRDLKALGYSGLTVDQLVSLRIHGATPEWIRELAALGYRALAVDGLVSLRIHGAGPEFIRELKDVGYDRLTTDQLVSLRIHGVTPEFVKRAKTSAGRPVAVDRLVEMRIHGRQP